LFYKVKHCLDAEMFDEMYKFFIQMTQLRDFNGFTESEYMVFSICLKNKSGPNRTSWRILNAKLHDE